MLWQFICFLLAWVQYYLAGLAVLQVKCVKVCEHLHSLVSLRNIKTLLNAMANLVTNLPPSPEASTVREHFMETELFSPEY